MRNTNLLALSWTSLFTFVNVGHSRAIRCLDGWQSKQSRIWINGVIVSKPSWLLTSIAIYFTPPKRDRGRQIQDPPRPDGEAGMPGASNIYFWQVMGSERGNRPQEAGWMTPCVVQRDVQPAIIYPACLAYWDWNGSNKAMLGISLWHVKCA